MDNSRPPLPSDDSRHALISRLARRVREVRKQKGLPRRVLSELSGVSPRYLAQLEAGEGNISIALLERVARALDVPMEALIARHIRVAPDVDRIASMIERATPEVRAQVMALLMASRPSSLRAGRICLLGLRGAGKTTLGRLAAKTLGVPFVELASLIEEETGMPLAEVLSLYGTDGFRRLEAEALERVIKQPGPVLLTVSGGLPEQAAPYARLLEHFHSIWLRTSVTEHAERMRAQGKLYPVRNDALATARIATLMDLRAPLYGRAHAQVDTSGLTAQHSVRDLIALIYQRRFLDTP